MRALGIVAVIVSALCGAACHETPRTLPMQPSPVGGAGVMQTTSLQSLTQQICSRSRHSERGGDHRPEQNAIAPAPRPAAHAPDADPRPPASCAA